MTVIDAFFRNHSTVTIWGHALWMPSLCGLLLAFFLGSAAVLDPEAHQEEVLAALVAAEAPSEVIAAFASGNLDTAMLETLPASQRREIETIIERVSQAGTGRFGRVGTVLAWGLYLVCIPGFVVGILMVLAMGVLMMREDKAGAPRETRP